MSRHQDVFINQFLNVYKDYKIETFRHTLYGYTIIFRHLTYGYPDRDNNFAVGIVLPPKYKGEKMTPELLSRFHHEMEAAKLREDGMILFVLEHYNNALACSPI
jgi:flavin-dependent dehydrogenase